ncbi:oocyte zinc finger protein XlCOF19-like [Folsomia candida]|uniref:Zinc finger imprinted 3 n=1 Tax=Folsomia candida TaxID=158441 RepID=A0A226D636_FOLCA|nr:oocyte zinc finger protein XlCOF19-like [Folsomia candida]OXA41015.1 Zinc finger imprinted 3 [Folsomia candida]
MAKNSCQTCNREFARTTHLQEHVTRMHTPRERQRPCPFAGCGKSFHEKVDVARHVKSMHNTCPRPPVPCTFTGCAKIFKHESTAFHHFQKEHVSNPVRFGCTLCGKEFREKPNLENHIAIHTGEKNYKCSICSRSYRHQSNFRAHQKTHLDKSARKIFKCALCSRNFVAKSTLARHMKDIHGNPVNYECPSCPKILTTPAGLKSHMVSNHRTDDVPRLSCDKCQHTTFSRSNLQQHVKRVHDGVKKKECYFCGTKFFTFTELVNHCRKIHTLKT